MTNNNLRAELEALLTEAGQAHHTAFKETNGEDPEWPLWYAEYLQERLSSLLGADITKSELVYLLLLVENERQPLASGENWPYSFSKFLLDRYE
jgi:hypothetical protein